MICLVQARMSSSRFPGKVLKKINGKELILIIYERLLKSKYIKKIYISTSSHKSDDRLCAFLKKKRISFFRGPLSNVAKRLMQNSESIGQNFFVRICGDSPLIDHKLVDSMIWKSKFELFDIFTNAFPKTYPAGMSVEIVKTSLIRRFIKRFNISDREHVTKYFYNNYKKFKIINFF